MTIGVLNNKPSPGPYISPQACVDYFSTEFSSHPASLTSSDETIHSNIPRWPPVNSYEIMVLIANLKSSRAPGPDGLPTEFF